MIWQAETPGLDDRDGVRAHLRGQLHDRVGACITQPVILDEVAAALAVAWRDIFRGMPLPPDALSLMAARTMWGMGEGEAARALTEGMTRPGPEGGELFALVEAGGPSLAACVGLGSGVLRPGRSALGGDGPCWVLDLAGLTTSSGHLAELGLPARVRRVLSHTAEIWDRADGAGVLGIARPAPRASEHLARLLREEVPGLCRIVLERARAERGWMRCPTVCRLGL